MFPPRSFTILAIDMKLGTCNKLHLYFQLRWLEIVLKIVFTIKQFTFIFIIITFMVAT